MKRIMIGLAAPLAALAIAGALAPAGAAHAAVTRPAAVQVHRPSAFDIPGSFCWGPPSSCIWTDGQNGTTLHNEPYFAGGHAQVYILEQAECGVIGPGCAPFTSGSGDNTLYSGFEIGTLNSVYTGYCADFPNLGGNVRNGPCSGINGEVVAFAGGTVLGSPIVFIGASNTYYATDHRQYDSVVLAGNVNNPTSGFLGVNLNDPPNFAHDANLNFSELRV